MKKIVGLILVITLILFAVFFLFLNKKEIIKQKDTEFLGQTVTAPIQVINYVWIGEEESQSILLAEAKRIRGSDCKRDCNIFIWNSKGDFDNRAETNEDFNHRQDFPVPLAFYGYLGTFEYKGIEVVSKELH
jgi:hypothetical protein